MKWAESSNFSRAPPQQRTLDSKQLMKVGLQLCVQVGQLFLIAIDFVCIKVLQNELVKSWY